MTDFVPHALVVPADRPQGRLALVLHGILGSHKNWRMFARGLAERLPGWRFALVDLRNHGASAGAPGPHTLSACADDLERLAEQLGAAPEVVIGHSFGGKVALEVAARAPAGLSTSSCSTRTRPATMCSRRRTTRCAGSSPPCARSPCLSPAATTSSTTWPPRACRSPSSDG